MSREKQLAKNTLIYFVGSFGSKLLSFLLLPVYSKYLTAEAYGNYDLIATIIQIIYPAITLMLDNAAYVFVIRTNEKQEKKDIISYALQILFRNSGISILVFLIINSFHPIKYIGWIILWLLSSCAYTMWSQITRCLNRQKLYSATGIIVTFVTLLGNIIGLVILKGDYKFLIISNCVAYILATIFMETQIHTLKCLVEGHPTRQLKRTLTKYSIPLMPNQISWWILNVSDRVMLAFFWGTSANGMYAMACKIPSVLNIVHNIFAAAWSDDILTSKNMDETQKYAERIYNSYIRLMLGISIVLIASNRLVFEFFIAGNFIEAYKYTYFLYVGFIFSSLGSLMGAFYGYYKKSFNVTLSTIVAAAVNFFINILFMDKYGIEVASISTCVGSVAIWIVRLLGLRNLIRIKIYNKNKMMLLILIPMFFVKYIESLKWNVVIIVFASIIAILINLDSLNRIVNIICKKVKK